MYRLLFQQFLRTKTCQLGLIILLVLGGISIITGKQFLIDQEKMASQVSEKQIEHIKRNVELHGEDLPLLLYYLKFSLVNQPHPLAGLAIGQKDLNPSVQQVTILTLEGQKYDANLVNPTKLLYGNLDLSFIIIYLFPLLIIAFSYNLYSEESESGTWQIVSVMARSTWNFLLAKLLVRFTVLAATLILLLLVGAFVMGLEFDGILLLFLLTSLCYLLFWFASCFWMISLKRNSNFNAILLLSFWLILVVLLPAFLNNYLTTQYPVPEALSTMIKQRDGYHQKWDTEKRATMLAFYKDYPQFQDYGFPPEEGFDWPWYYAMQHLGDAEAREESQAMQEKIRLREKMSRLWAQLIPSMHAQLVVNDLAGTGLVHHMNFLNYTNQFHEKTRLYFYPKIFTDEKPSSVDWDRFNPAYVQLSGQAEWTTLTPLLLATLLFVLMTFYQVRKP